MLLLTLEKQNMQMGDDLRNPVMAMGERRKKGLICKRNDGSEVFESFYGSWAHKQCKGNNWKPP